LAVIFSFLFNFSVLVGTCAAVKAGIDSPAVRQRIELDEKSNVSMETSNPMAKLHKRNAAFVASQH
jgi:hypothetical protein